MTSSTERDLNSDSFAEDTILTDVLGNHAKVKILSALLSEANHDVNISDLARMAGVNRSTIYEHIDDLRAYDLVVQTRTTGNAKMYQINTDSPAAKALGKLEWALLNELADKEESNQIDEETGEPVP